MYDVRDNQNIFVFGFRTQVSLLQELPIAHSTLAALAQAIVISSVRMHTAIYYRAEKHHHVPYQV